MSDRETGLVNPWLLDSLYAEDFAIEDIEPLGRGELDFLPPESPRPGEPLPTRLRPCEDDAEHLAGKGGAGFAGMDLIRAGRLRRW